MAHGSVRSARLVLPFGSASLSSAAPTAAGKDHKISVVFDAAQLDAVRHGADKARKAHQEGGDLKALRGELARRAAKNGETLLDQDTESFALSPDVSMAVPKGLMVKSVNVHSDGDKVVADVESEDTTDQTVTTQGQGMVLLGVQVVGHVHHQDLR